MDFRQAFVDETLAAEAGIDGHHEQQINFVEIRRGFSDGGGRVDGEADFFAERFYFPEELRDFVAELDVDDDLVRAGFDKWLQQNFRFAANQMHVEKKFFGVRPHGGDDGGAEGNVRHELAVHDIEV